MTPKQIIYRALGGALFFGLLGPPLGGSVLYASLVVIATLPGGSGLTENTSIEAFPMFLGFSYFVGGLPALLTGICAGPLRERFNSWLVCIVVGLWGTALTLTYWFVFTHENPLVGFPHSFLLLGVPSIVAGAAVSWLFRSRSGASVPSLKASAHAV